MKNLYIDFDGVILDTINVTYEMMREAGISRYDKEKIEDFYQNLEWKNLLKTAPQISDSIECIKKIIDSKKFKVYILTHVNSLNEVIEKIKFVRKHIPCITIIPVPKVIHKTEIVFPKDSILIDDYAGNLREWQSKEGIGILFSLKPKNKGFIVIDRLDEVLEMDFSEEVVWS